MSELDQITMSEHDARRLTERIRIAAVNYSEAKEKLLRLVHDAKEGAAHVALGYASWTAYLADVMSEEPLRLARDDRREVVQLLSDEGMSTRAIAPIVGVKSDQTVRADLGQVRDNHAPTSATRVSDATSAPSAPSPAPAPSAVIGMDGKTYQRPEAQGAPKPKSEAVTTQFSTAVTELNRVLDKFHRIQSSKNFPANKNQVATLHGNDLARAISELQNLADQLH